ncbi:hypothetical protein BD309DRAFT_873299, partial [Dichomitus squalens]
AHSQAATLPEPFTKILHRDISGGNILILPCLHEEPGGSYIEWSGLLTDWEMSKPLPDGVAGEARQPERTGTWQFLSVAILSRLKEVEICDELESFFYVILYYAVRYLRSNIGDGVIGTWIHTFFDTYGFDGKTYVCGQAKLNAIENGKLIISAGKTLKFDSPMDDVIAELLSWFKAHHTVTMHELKSQELKNNPSASRNASTSTSVVKSFSARRRRRPSKSQALQEVMSTTPSQAEQRPSEKELKLSGLLKAHRDMHDWLAGAIDLEKPDALAWKMDDKVGERIPKDYHPPAQVFGPTLPATLAHIKRPRLEKPKLEDEREAMPFSRLTAPGDLPPREPRTPQREPPFVSKTGHPILERE